MYARPTLILMAASDGPLSLVKHDAISELQRCSDAREPRQK